MSDLHSLLTILISGLGLLVPIVYFVSRLIRRDDTATRAFWARLGSAEIYERRQRRRALGMAIMALISVVFFLGTRFLNPRPNPNLALLFWGVLLLLLAWLCILAMIDLIEARHLRRRLLGAARGMFLAGMRQCDTDADEGRKEEV